MEYLSLNIAIINTRLDHMLMAIGLVVLASAVVSVLSKINRQTFPPTPIFEILIRPIAAFLIDRLNRHNRGAFSLVVRGMIVYVILMCGVFFALWGARYMVPYSYFDVLFLVLLMSPALSLFTVFQLSKPKPFEKTYFHTVHALNRNLIKVDASGHRRNGFDLLALSLGEWFVAPLFFYMVGGIGFAYFYCVLSLFCRVAGAQGQSTLFASLFGTLWVGLQFIPNMIAAGMVVVASLFTPKGKSLSAVRGISVPHLFATYAYALGITLGGAYQDRNGQAVERPWVGAAKSSAKVNHKDILRGCYLHGVTVLLIVLMLVAARLAF